MSACFNEDVLLSYCERKLPAATADEVKAHVDGCADCRIIVSELARGGAPEPEGELDTARALARGSTLGRYVVLEQIGAGGMGVVYAAYDPDLDRRVAMKLLRNTGGEKHRDRLVREARAMAQLSHPNVAQVFGVEKIDERVFVTMEFIVGDNARRWAATERSLAEILDVFLQAGRGLEAAHHAGIVHRDFKPDNMMVRPNGRVSVLDFGLARPTGVTVAGGSGAAARASSLTETGTVMGTLRYMPPEQREGRATDARADQYAFCVSLHEVLYGAPPGAPPTRSPKVPGRLSRALERGRSEDAASRFPDLHALLVELERVRAPRRRWGVPLGLATAALAAGAFFFATPRGPAPCADAPAELAQVWSPAQRAEVERAFAAAELPSTEVLLAVDAYGARWAEAHLQACQATRVHGTQSPELLDRRMLCLEARKAALGATAKALAHGGPSLQRAPIAVAQLPLIDDCADARWLLEAVPPPSDPKLRAKLADVRQSLAKVRAVLELGRVDEAVQVAADVVAAAEGVSYPPLLAEALGAQVEALRQSLDTTTVEPVARHAVKAALESRDPRLQADAWISLADVVGNTMRRFDEAEKLFEVAKASVGALDKPGLIEARWYRWYGKLHEAMGDAPGAIAAYRASLERYEGQERAPRGVQAWLWRRISLAHLIAEQVEPADVASKRAVELAEADATGASQLDLVLSGRADVLRERHAFDEARQTLLRALALSRKGGNTRSIAITLAVLGSLEKDAGDLPAAERWYQQLVACVEQQPEPNPYYAQGLAMLGGVQLERGDSSTALRTLTRATAMFDRFGLGNDHATVAWRIKRAEAELAEGRPADGRASLGRAIDIMAASSADAQVLAADRFDAAKVLWQLDRKAAVQLATAARDGSSGAPRAGIEQWLAKHR